MKKTYGFVMTDAGKLPDAIRNALASELPQYAKKRVKFTFEICNDDGTPMIGDDTVEVTDNR